MNIVVIGGTGLIGSHVVAHLREHGHQAVPASPRLGINTITGEGLAEALTGAATVIDVANAPAWDDDAVMDFFTTSTRNLVAAARAAGVKHYVALSVVGTDRMQESGYFRAKLAQETLITQSGLPYTIVRATQFFEFMQSIADTATDGALVRLPPAGIQPMAAADVASAVAKAAAGSPVNGIIEVAGPDQFRLDTLIGDRLRAIGDPRQVITDPQASYYGVQPGANTLLPGVGALLATTRFTDWAAAQAA